MQVLAVIDAPPGSNNVARMYSYTSERWVIVGAPITAPGDDPLWTFESLYPAQFFGDDGFFHLRMVTNTGLSGGNGGPGTIQSFLIRYDYVDFVPTGITGGGGGDDDG